MRPNAALMEIASAGLTIPPIAGGTRFPPQVTANRLFPVGPSRNKPHTIRQSDDLET